MGGVERTEERKCFAVAVKKRNGPTLTNVIRQYVLPGSIVYTDLWRGYNAIPSDLDLEHLTVNHSKYFKDPVTGVHTNTIEGTWNGMKRGIPERNQHSGRVGNHIAEFIWRRQVKGNEWEKLLQCMRNTALN